jgi:hypothetical protein
LLTTFFFMVPAFAFLARRSGEGSSGGDPESLVASRERGTGH